MTQLAERPDTAQIDRLQRLFEQEQTASTSLNLRGSTFGGCSAIGLLLVAQFGATWLDESSWTYSGLVDTVLEASLTVAVLGFAGCVLLSLVAIAPRSTWRRQQRKRTEGHSAVTDDEVELVASMLKRQGARNDGKSRLLLVSAILLAVAVVACGIQAAAFALGADVVTRRAPLGAATADAGAGPRGAGEPRLSAATRRKLVSAHAPVVWLHSRDPYAPMTAEAFLSGSRLIWRSARGRERRHARRGEVEPARLGAGCRTHPSGCYTEGSFTADEHTRPHNHRERAAGLPARQGFALNAADSVLAGTGVTAPFYSEIRERPNSDELRLTYWFFYGFSRPFHAVKVIGVEKNVLPFSHEGDWENVDVVLGAKDLEPRRVEYFGHGAPTAVPWARVEREGDTHPVVFSARSSHASYSNTAERQGRSSAVCRRLAGVEACSYDLRERGVRWAPWERSGGGLRDVRAEPWYGYGGAWGRSGDAGDATGPLGPSRYKGAI